MKRGFEGEIFKKFELVLENGNVIKCIFIVQTLVTISLTIQLIIIIQKDRMPLLKTSLAGWDFCYIEPLFEFFTNMRRKEKIITASKN